MAISALDNDTAKLLTTTQVITSVSSAVKELVENAFDANAKSVEVTLVDNGLTLIEIRDDGIGIPKRDTEFMGLPHYTSKITNFNDLETLESYGFRGEALNALCRVANVTIITRTVEDDAATSYTIDHKGNISFAEPSHHSVGTTIRAKQLFKEFPVRRNIVSKPRIANQEVKLVENLLKCFGICQPQIRMSYRVNNNVVFTKPSLTSTREALIDVIGKKVVSNLEWVELENEKLLLQLMLPKKDLKDLSEVYRKGRPYIFINGRPVEYKQFEKVIIEKMSYYFGDKISTKKKLVFLMCLKMAPTEVDVNLEPNKTIVLLKNEDEILKTVDDVLAEYYDIPKRHMTPMQNSSADTSTGYQDYTLNTESVDCIYDGIQLPASKRPRLDAPELTNERKRNGSLTAADMKLMADDFYDDQSMRTDFDHLIDPGCVIINDNIVADPNESMIVNQSFEVIEENRPVSKKRNEAAIQSNVTMDVNHSTNTGVSAMDSISGTLGIHHVLDLSESDSNDTDTFELSKIKPQDNLDHLRHRGDNTGNIVLSPGNSEPFEFSPTDAPGLTNLNGQCISAMKEQKFAAEKEIETLSQLPVVDLGGDFNWQEILEKSDPARDVGALTERENVLIANLNRINGTENELEQKSEFGEVSKVSPDETKALTNIPLHMWSRGQVPGLQGKTDVKSFDNTIKTASSSTSAKKDGDNSFHLGFTRFSRDIRPKLIQENPKISLPNMAKMMAARWKELSSEERGYYKDLALEAKKNSEEKISKMKEKAEIKESEKNKKRLLQMFEKMKKEKIKKNGRCINRTTISRDLTMQNITTSVPNKPKYENTTPIIGPLNCALDSRVWIVQWSGRIWGLSTAGLLKELNCPEIREKEVDAENLAPLVQRWFLEKRNDQSVMHLIHNHIEETTRQDIAAVPD